MSNKAVPLLYRLFLRSARDLEKRQLELPIRMPMSKDAWLVEGGAHRWDMPPEEYSNSALKKLFPFLSDDIHGQIQPGQLKQIIKDAFRHTTDTSAVNGFGDPLDRAFVALKALNEQMMMAKSSSICRTRNVQVDVTSAYLGKQSELDTTYEAEEGVPEKLYFTYRVRISNLGDEIVQLLSRHWIIKNNQGNVVAEVPKGAPGVVGCTPILKPNTCFQYYSGTDCESAGGSMSGSFQMAILDATTKKQIDHFDAEIAPFSFILPPSEKLG